MARALEATQEAGAKEAKGEGTEAAHLQFNLQLPPIRPPITSYSGANKSSRLGSWGVTPQLRAANYPTNGWSLSVSAGSLSGKAGYLSGKRD